jgi:hypothetical protein
MAAWDDVRRLALALPETTEESKSTGPRWLVRGRAFVNERPLRRADLAALGDAAPDGPVALAAVPDEGVKQALVASEPDVFFTTPHFDGYPAVLFRLDRIGLDELQELVVEAWLVAAPKRLARQFLDEHREGEDDAGGAGPQVSG